MPVRATAPRARAAPGRPRRPGHARAEDRAGRADLEARRARALARGVLDDERAARVACSIGDVAGLERVERERPRREHGVEHLRLQRRDAGSARRGDRAPELAARSSARARSALSPVAAEALRAEAIRQAARASAREPRARRARERSGVDARARRSRSDSPRSWPVRSLCGWRTASSTRAPGSSSASAALRVEARHREPLRRDRDAVLAPGVADVARRARRPRARARAPPPRWCAGASRRARRCARPRPSARRAAARRRESPRASARIRDHGSSGSCGDRRERAPVHRGTGRAGASAREVLARRIALVAARSRSPGSARRARA